MQAKLSKWRTRARFRGVVVGLRIGVEMSRLGRNLADTHGKSCAFCRDIRNDVADLGQAARFAGDRLAGREPAGGRTGPAPASPLERAIADKFTPYYQLVDQGEAHRFYSGHRPDADPAGGVEVRRRAAVADGPHPGSLGPPSRCSIRGSSPWRTRWPRRSRRRWPTTICGSSRGGRDRSPNTSADASRAASGVTMRLQQHANPTPDQLIEAAERAAGRPRGPGLRGVLQHPPPARRLPVPDALTAPDRGPATGVVAAWDRFFFTPADPRPLGLIRIAVGPAPALELRLAVQRFARIPGLGRLGRPGSPAQRAAKHLGMVALVARARPDALGWRGAWTWSSSPSSRSGVASRVTAPLAWAIAVSTTRRNPIIIHGFEQILTLWLFYLAVCGSSGLAYSVDRLIARRRGGPDRPVPSVAANIGLRLDPDQPGDPLRRGGRWRSCGAGRGGTGRRS